MSKLPETVIAEGKVSDDGKHFQPDLPAALAHGLKFFAGQKAILKIEAWTERRSLQHNNYWWTCIVTPLSEYTGYEKEEMHEMLLIMLASEVRFISDKNGELIEEVRVAQRSSKMPKKVFSELVRKGEKLMAECGIPLKPWPELEKYEYAEAK